MSRTRTIDQLQASVNELRDWARTGGMHFRDRDPHVGDLHDALRELEQLRRPDCPRGHPGRYTYASAPGQSACVACERDKALDEAENRANERDQLLAAREGVVRMLADREQLLLAYEHRPDAPEPPIVRGALDAQEAAEQRVHAAKAETKAMRSALHAAYSELWQTYGPTARLTALYEIMEAALGDGEQMAVCRTMAAGRVAAAEVSAIKGSASPGSTWGPEAMAVASHQAAREFDAALADVDRRVGSGGVRCRDCHMAYREHGLDVTLPDDQWAAINGAPAGTEVGGVLCGTCIARRAKAMLPDAIAVRARIEVAGEQPVEALQDLFYNPVSQVYFRAGLLVAREAIARHLEIDAGSADGSVHEVLVAQAGQVRATWWPSLGPDLGAPRLLEFLELMDAVSGEGGEHYKAKPAGKISPTLEALPVALQFMQLQDEAAAHAAGG